jgi:NADH-quinone oxidoreductase subunit E
MVNWEFYDNQTTESARKLVDGLRSGKPPAPTRGAPLCKFKETERILAGFPDPRPDVGQGGAGAATLAGLRVAKERNMTAPTTMQSEAMLRSGAESRPSPESSGEGQ